MDGEHTISEDGPSSEPDNPGGGPTMTVSTSLHRGTVEAVRRKVGKRGFSGYVEAALRRQLELDNLAELIDEYTSSSGDFTPEELAAARAELFGTDAADAGHAA